MVTITPTSWPEYVLYKAFFFSGTPVWLTVNGRRFIASKPADPNRYNCHGLTFGGGLVSVFSGDVPGLLDAYGYVELPDGTPPQPGDVRIYSTSQGISHSETVESTGSQTTFLGKNGENGSWSIGPINGLPPQRVKVRVFRQVPRPY